MSIPLNLLKGLFFKADLNELQNLVEVGQKTSNTLRKRFDSYENAINNVDFLLVMTDDEEIKDKVERIKVSLESEMINLYEGESSEAHKTDFLDEIYTRINKEVVCSEETMRSWKKEILVMKGLSKEEKKLSKILARLRDYKNPIVGHHVREFMDMDTIIGLKGVKSMVTKEVSRAQNRTLAGSGLCSFLLYGPPGTGKTEISGAIAKKLNLDYWNIGFAFLSKWIGEGPDKIRQVFSAMGKRTQGVLFLDEADGYFTSMRGKTEGGDQVTSGVGYESKKEITNAFKQEFSKLRLLAQKYDNTFFVIILAANDPKFMSPAMRDRIPTMIYVPLPDLESRHKLFRLFFDKLRDRNYRLDGFTEETFKKFARWTENFSGRNIKNVCNKAVTASYETIKEMVKEKIMFIGIELHTSVARYVKQLPVEESKGRPKRGRKKKKKKKKNVDEEEEPLELRDLMFWMPLKNEEYEKMSLFKSDYDFDDTDIQYILKNAEQVLDLVTNDDTKDANVCMPKKVNMKRVAEAIREVSKSINPEVLKEYRTERDMINIRSIRETSGQDISTPEKPTKTGLQ